MRKMFSRRATRTFLAMLLALTALSTCCRTASAQTDDDAFRVALTGKYPPFSYYDENGELAGFDVDVAKEIGKRLNRPVEILATEWDGILAGLLAEKYDAIIGSMAITPERLEKVEFSTPYYRSGAQLFVHRENPRKVYSIEECNGLRIAAVLGETYQQYLEQEYPEIDIVTLKSSVEIFEILEQHRITGFVSDKLVGLWQIKNNERPFVPVGDMLYSEQMAIPVRKEDTRLLEQIDSALEQMRDDGTLKEIHNRYFGIGGNNAAASGGSKMPPSVVARKLITGFAKTLGIAASALALGFILAIPIGALLNKQHGAMKIIYYPARTIVDFIRGTPVLIQLLFVWLGLGLPPITAAILTLGINAMSYMAEVVRSGLMSVDPGQILAGRALGLSRFQVFRHIVWPQAFRIAVPPLMNSIVALTKDTALVSVISVPEVVREAQSIISVTFEPQKYYFIVAVMFFIVTFPLMKAASRLEARIKARGFNHD